MQIKVVFIEAIKAKECVRESVIHKQIDVFKSLWKSSFNTSIAPQKYQNLVPLYRWKIKIL